MLQKGDQIFAVVVASSTKTTYSRQPTASSMSKERDSNCKYPTLKYHFINFETRIGVRVGEYDLRTTTDCQTDNGEEICSPPVQDLAIEKVIPHARFDSKSILNDIALIRVSKIDLEQGNKSTISSTI